MAEAGPVSGFPPAEALWRLLAKKGNEDGFQAFKDTHGSGPNPEQLVATLERLGIPARVALLQGEDLRFLELPTLVELPEGTWVLLEAFRKGRFQVETAGGSRFLAPDALSGRVSGRALDLSPALPPGATLWARLKPLFLRQRQCLWQIGAAMLMLQLMALVTPALTAIVLDRALPDGARSLLGLVLAGLGLAMVHLVGIGWIQGRALLFLATRVEVGAERGFLEHALRCPFPFLQSRTLGELLQAFHGFEAARELLPVQTVGVFLNGAMGLLYLGVMFALLPGFTLVILLATGSLALLALLAGRMQAKLQAKQVEAAAREQGLLIELVAGITTLKAAGAEAKALGRWKSRCRKVLALELARGRLNLGSALALGLVSQALALGLFTSGGLRLLDGTLRVGTLFAFLQLSAGFTGSFLAVVHTSLTLLILQPQLSKAQEILAVAPEPFPRRPPPVQGPVPVVMEGVWFRYTPASPWVLQGYDLRLEAGKKFILQGPSGFGKTTILRLLAGLHDPEQGRVLVGGLSPQEARHNLLYLPQFLRIFGGSILDNLRVYSQGAPLYRLLETARQTGLQGLVDTLPMGYQTLLPPGGRTLSGGQRQLIALTGAMASGRPLMLLDEALANLDAGFAGPLEQKLALGPWTMVAVQHSPLHGNPQIV